MTGAILHAAENIKGGVGTYLRDLLAMQRESFGDGVVTALLPASQASIVRAPAGIEIVTFDDRGPRWLSTLRLASSMRQLMARKRPDVVHLHSTFAGAALRPLLKLVGGHAKIVYCAHGWAFDRETSFVSRLVAKLLERILSHWCDAVICISRHEMTLAERIGIAADKLLLISNGIPRDNPRVAWNPADVEWPEGKRRVLFVGRFDRQKGTDVLLAALGELQDTAHCYLVGESVLGDGNELVLPPNARATGWLSPNEIEVFYRSADVVVVPSRWEGFGLIAAEAMRAGLPVIASRVGGLVEIVEDGVTGVLVPPGDTAALVSALRDTSDDRLDTMGRAGRQRFLRHFTMERVHRQITELYNSGVRETAGST
jgi:glycosyltransferase involved in cell wall biosynthesis